MWICSAICRQANYLAYLASAGTPTNCCHYLQAGKLAAGLKHDRDNLDAFDAFILVLVSSCHEC